MGNIEWLDVTEEFIKSIKGLKLGELVKRGSFTLFEAMSAIELMDPKIDTGMISNRVDRQILNLEQSVKCGKVKITNFDDAELIGIIDDTYACLVTWLKGHSLADTVMTNLYLHEPERVEDKSLRIFSYSMLKITDIFKDIALAKYCFEEEDFSPGNVGFNLATNISDAKVLASLREICDHLQDRLLDCEDEEKEKSPRALLVRFNFTKYLYHSLVMIRKDLINPHATNTNKQKNIPNAIHICDNIERNLIQCQQFIRSWKDSLDLGIKPNEGAVSQSPLANNHCEHNKIESFEKFNGQTERSMDAMHNLCHSYTKQDKILNPLTESHQFVDYPTIMGFEPLINHKRMPAAYPKCPSINSRENSVDYLDKLAVRLAYCCHSSRINSYNDIVKFMNHFSNHFGPSSCVISRSFLQLIYLPNRDLSSMREVLRQSICDLFNPAIFQTKNTIFASRPKLKERIDGFFADCAGIFSRKLLIYGHNRARQREKLIDHLESLKMLQYKAIFFDDLLGAGSSSNYFSYWIGYYIIKDSIQFVLSGVELELYSIYEYDYIFWYLHELLYDKQVEILNVAKNCIDEKAKKKGMNPIQREYALAEALKSLSGGIFALISGLKLQSKIRTPRSDYTSEETVFVNRFKLLMGASVAKTLYDQYILASVAIMDNELNPYSSALAFFAKSKALLEQLSDTDDEVTAYLKVAKTNLIVTRLLATNPGVSSKDPEFDLSVHPHLPILKII